MRHALEVHHVCDIGGGEDQGEKDQSDDGTDGGGHVDIAVVEGVRKLSHCCCLYSGVRCLRGGCLQGYLGQSLSHFEI
jgi:hypothetical protein